MALQQVNLRVEQRLLASLKVLARERGLSLNAAAALAFEQFLQGQPQQKQADASGDQEQRLLALEKRVAKLEAKPAPPSATGGRFAQADVTHPGGAENRTHGGDRSNVSGTHVDRDAITTAQLAARLGIKRGTFNERLRRAGGAGEGVVVEGWRCVGQSRPTNGGPLQWVWRLA